MSILDKANAFDPQGEIRTEIDDALVLLDAFREKFPFHLNPSSIDELTPDELYNPHTGAPDHFFYWVETKLRSLGGMSPGTAAGYKNAKSQIDFFRRLLHQTFYSDITLSQRVDLPWEDIRGLGGDKNVMKKVISLYFDDVLPIFQTPHLIHFYIRTVGDGMIPPAFDRMSVGEKYQYLMDGIVSKKDGYSVTAEWSSPYFVKFLYDAYPMTHDAPDQPEISISRLREVGLDNHPKTEQEVLFLFAKLHVALGYPRIVKVRQGFPDVQAIDENNDTVRIELETIATNFIGHGHDPSKCDIVVCWEDDRGDFWPKHWPRVVSLREYLANNPK